MNDRVKRRPTPQASAANEKDGLHPRSRHRGRYDFRKLVAVSPDLAPYVIANPQGDDSIDFADPFAVRALNRAILRHEYGIARWDIPADFLCPPIPGRADYLHHAADLLASCNNGAIPRGAGVRVVDIGVGANCIYPLIGHREYGWSFVGTDSNPAAIASANRIIQGNQGLGDAIACRQQGSASRIFTGVLKADERFDLTMCNPPFHESAAEAISGSERKWRNLGKATTKSPVLNFGGQAAELWCQGGEAAFVRRMVAESAGIKKACFWFSTLVAKESHLPTIHDALRAAKVVETRIIPMTQGQKKSRIVAWTFLDAMQRSMWRQVHWPAKAAPKA